MWLCPYIRNRKGKSNFPEEQAEQEQANDEIIDDEREDEVYEHDNENDNDLSDNGDAMSPPACENNERHSKRKESCIRAQSVKSKRIDSSDQSKQELMSNLSKFMASRMEKPSTPNKSEDDIFGSMVSSQLAKLSGLFKVQAQHEISNTLFRFIMAQESQRTPINTYQSPSQISYNQSLNARPLHSPLSSSSSVSTPDVGSPSGGWLASINTNNTN